MLAASAPNSVPHTSLSAAVTCHPKAGGVSILPVSLPACLSAAEARNRHCQLAARATPRLTAGPLEGGGTGKAAIDTCLGEVEAALKGALKIKDRMGPTQVPLRRQPAACLQHPCSQAEAAGKPGGLARNKHAPKPSGHTHTHRERERERERGRERESSSHQVML